MVGLEDDFPFQTGDFQVPAVHFPGCQKKRFGVQLPLIGSHQIMKQLTYPSRKLTFSTL